MRPGRSPVAAMGLLLVTALGGCDDGASTEPVDPGVSTEPALLEAAPVAPDVVLPAEIAWRLPDRQLHSPVVHELFEELVLTRELLVETVKTYGRDPENPWAVTHAMLALGPDIELTNGAAAVDHLFAEYAKTAVVGSETVVRFPRSRGSIRIEPHTDLILKALTETGSTPDREVVVGGETFPLSALYRHSLSEAWVDGDALSYSTWNDAPWSLQGLATWAPADLSWTAEGRHEMTMDGFTSAAVSQLVEDTAFLQKAMEAGEPVEKRKQGIFSYTCGGAHMLQGTAYAVARGFGTEADRAAITAQVPILFYRYGFELEQIDRAIEKYPEYAIILLVQRLKFIGHFIESTHKLAALGFYTPDEAQAKAMRGALDQLVATVAVLNQMKVFAQLELVRTNDEQIYLDVIGDSAHAIRGIDLATGVGAVSL